MARRPQLPHRRLRDERRAGSPRRLVARNEHVQLVERTCRAAVRPVNRRQDHAADYRRHDARFGVEFEVREGGRVGATGVPQEGRDARAGALLVPVRPVVGLHSEQPGDPLALRLQLLQGDAVRLLASDPLDQLRSRARTPLTFVREIRPGRKPASPWPRACL